MLELLREYDVATRFRALRGNGANCFIAAPFWGNGAPELLEVTRGSQIICNLESPGCNPNVVRALRDTPGVLLRSHPQLHAKIYATNNFVIVGSSNASTKGLGANGVAWIEANSAERNASLSPNSAPCK
jgi:hypothetical protein